MKKNSFLNIFLSILLFFIVFSFVSPLYAATNLEYNFIEGLPFIGDRLTSTGPGTLFVQYIGNVYTIILGGAAILALLMLIVGGVQYTYVALSPSAKNDAKTRMFNALVGLLIVLGAYLILNTINPDFVRLDLSIEPITSERGFGGGVNTNPLPPGSVNNTPGVVAEWSSAAETEKRNRLRDANITINNPDDCGTETYQGYLARTGRHCTSTGGLSDNAVNGVIGVKQGCDQTQGNCTVQVNGGSEAGHSATGGHSQGNAIDIDRNDKVDAYINSLGSSSTCTIYGKEVPARVVNGAKYCQEDSHHWHVIY